MARTLQEDRDRARRYATSIVGFAIMAMGAALLVAGIAVPIRGGAGLLLLGLLLGLLGAVALVGGFFFHLIPSRIDTLADEKREYDARERAGGHTGNGNGTQARK